MISRHHPCLFLLGFLAVTQPARARGEAVMTFRSLTPDAALTVARAALAKCRDDGFQIAVAVPGRAGNPQVMPQSRFADPHTPVTDRCKAWTAITFREKISVLAKVVPGPCSM